MKKQKILVVDDDPRALRLLKPILEEAGYEVVCAAAGDQALRVAIEENPAVIILDVMLPDIDGAQVACMIKENSATTRIPIIFLTGLATPDEEVRCGLDARALLSKPVSAARLLETVRCVIESCR